jgi:Trk K+ transport system NAD-binding subunit
MYTMKDSRFVVIGLGQIGRELIRRLSRDFGITCIALNPDAEETLRKLKREDAELITGDATSRLVLEDARVDDASAVIVTTTIERVNIEVATILKEHFNPQRVISVALTQKGMEALEALGVEVDNIFTAGALGIRNRIEEKSKAAHAIGLGKDEILEVEVHPDSRLTNKPLGLLDPIKWRVGIVYREGNIIVPKPDTVLRPKDKVIILGDPAVLKTVSEMLTFSFQKFPLEYGQTVIVYFNGREEEPYLQEVNYIFSVFPMKRAVLILSKRAQTERFRKLLEKLEVKEVSEKTTLLPPLDAIRATLGEISGEQGLVIFPDSVVQSLAPSISDVRKKTLVSDVLALARCPVLIGRGTFPYEKMAVPCVEGTNVEHAMESAFEISSSLSSRVTALQVRPSSYIAGREEMEDFEERKKAISHMSLIYRAKVQIETLEGNPVKAVLGSIGEFNLLLADMSASKAGGVLFSLLNPDVTWKIVRGAPVSTLVVPPVAESL